MTKIQFRVLYREFLFRVVDLELLSPQGDVAKLLGQFGAVLVFLSFTLAFRAIFVTPTPAILWEREHALISSTMVVVGLFAVLSWDSAFPDRRDVLVLAPLPVRARTIFLAKIIAVATALSLTVVALNCLTGLAWPMVFAGANAGFTGVIRSLAAYWITMAGAGVFIFCCVLAVHGLAAQLPRRRYLRLSALLQIAVFALFLSVYMTLPAPSARFLAAPESWHRIEWLPSYWFFGLFQELNGSIPIAMHSTLASLARRALIGLAIASSGAGVAFLLSYFRTLRKIVEEPEIVPGTNGIHWLPRFGNSLSTGIVHFSIRTLMRSRQHRVILAFYLGVAFAILLIAIQAPPPRRPPTVASAAPVAAISAGWLFASLLMMCCSVAGTRAVFAMPIQLKANWVFRITPIPGPRETLVAVRRAFLTLSAGPVWIASAAVLFSTAPWRIAAGHLIALGLLGMILVDLSLIGFQKLPFTCSYLPGKSGRKGFLTVAGTFLILATAVEFELGALASPARYAVMIGILCAAAACARRVTLARTESPDGALLFEEKEAPEIFALDLHRDGRFQN